MRHVVLTRSAYGPEWTLPANRRRLAVTRAVTAHSLAAQAHRDWTWIVLLDPRDQLLGERMAVFAAAAPAFVPILWEPTDVGAAPWDPNAARTTRVQQVAATAYRGPWAQAVGDRDGTVLQTRLDDDDGLTADALARTVTAAALVRGGRTALMQPVGHRLWAGQVSLVRHETNAMHSLLTGPGDTLGVYDYGHRRVARVAPVVMVDQEPAWLWYRHRDTISGWRHAERPMTPAVRRLYPVDWSALL